MRSVMKRAAMVVAAVASTAAAQPAQLAVVDAARTEELTQLREVTGSIRSLRRTLLASQVEGFVVQLDVDEGDAVEAGQVVAQLDATTAELDVAQATADVEAAKGVIAEAEATLARSQRDLQRVQEAQKLGSVSASELDEAETDVRTGEAVLAQARARLAAAEADLGRKQKDLHDKSIIAPFAGRVVKKSAEVGEWLSTGDAVLEILSTSELEARIDVPERFVRFLGGESAPIGLSVPALGQGQNATGTLIGVVPLADELSRLFPVRLSVPNEHGVLKPGMSLTAFVPTGEKAPTLTVSKDAVLRDDAGEYVYMAVPKSDEKNPAVNGQAIPARITSLYAVGNRVAIRPGQVQEGTLVLVEGNERVYPTQALIISNPPPGSPFAKGNGAGDGEREAQATTDANSQAKGG